MLRPAPVASNFANLDRMPRVTILPVDLSTEVPSGESLLDAGYAAGVGMSAGCCNCSCGSCVVAVEMGSTELGAPGREELEVLAGLNLAADRFRLACAARLLGGAVVIRQLD